MISSVELSDLVGSFTHRNVDTKALQRIARTMERFLDTALDRKELLFSATSLFDEICWRSDKEYLRRTALWRDQITVFKNDAPSLMTEISPNRLEILLGIGSEDSRDWPAIERIVRAFHAIATASEASTVDVAFDAGCKLVKEVFARDEIDYLQRFAPWSDEFEEGYLKNN